MSTRVGTGPSACLRAAALAIAKNASISAGGTCLSFLPTVTIVGIYNIQSETETETETET